MRPLTIIWLPFRIFLNIILIPVLTVGYLLIVIFIAIPSHIFRKLISVIAHQFDSDLEKLVTPLGNVVGRDYSDWFTHPTHSVNVVIKLRGDVSIESLRQLVLSRMVKKCSAADELELEYPELQQYCTKRLGYLFFKWDRNFDIANHVKTYDSETQVVDELNLTTILEHASTKPFQRRRSAWEVLFIPHFSSCSTEIQDFQKTPETERCSVFILRMHHGISDGMSIYRCLLGLTDHGLEMWEKDISQFKVPKHFDFYFNLNALTIGPGAFVNTLTKEIDCLNPFHKPIKNLTGEYNIAKVTFDLKVIKTCRRANLNVSFHSVLIAGLTGGLRNFMKKNNLKLPNSLSPMRLGMPIPKPGHSTKLRNEYLSAGIDLPIHKNTPRKRIVTVNQHLKRIHRGGMVPIVTQAQLLMGGFPVEWVRGLTRKAGITVIYSEIKGPVIPLKVGNGKMMLEDLYFSMGLGTDDLGMAFCTISYHDKINLVLTVDQGILRDKTEVDELMKCIEKEIMDLQYGDVTNV